MTVNDTVRIRLTDAIGTVIEVHGHHVTVKCDTLSLPAEVFLMDELELIGSDDDTLIGCIKQSEADAI